MVFSCQNDFEEETSNQNEKGVTSKKQFDNIGKKLKNPYTVENMRKALKKLKEKGLDKSSQRAMELLSDFEIEPSHLYVMYEPATIEEEAELKQDSTLVLADYPLDYEFTDEELANRPPLAEGEIPDYYTAILVDSEEAADAQYVLMDELYIPEEDPYFTEPDISAQMRTTDPNKINNKEDLLRHLLYEAYKLTGNEAELESPDNMENGRWIFGTRWWPSGTIQVYDEVAGRSVPVVGGQVLMRQWFTVRQGITDANGYFKTSSVRGSARYVIQWERYHYSIRNGSFFQAETRGPVKKASSWNHTITGGDDKYHALIHQAAHDYYYGHRFGLTSPLRNSYGGRQMKIAARETNEGNLGSYSHLRNDLTLGLLAQIHIRTWGLSSDRVYGTTAHELTHAAHSMLDRFSYDNLVRDAWIIPWNGGAVVDNNRRTLESWARAVETFFALDRYKNKFGNNNYNYYLNGLNNYQNQKTFDNIHYTSAGIDLTDDFNQRSVNGYAYPIDRVSGYTLKQVESALYGARSWWQWRDNLKNRFDNPTEQYVDELFNNWEPLQ